MGHTVLGLSDTTVLAIYRDILKVPISRYFVINYRDTMPVHYCHYKFICYAVLGSRILVSHNLVTPAERCEHHNITSKHVLQ